MMRVVAAALVAFGLTAASAVASVEEQILERIAPVGKVCLQGEDCGSAAAAPAAASGGGAAAARSGEEVYNAACTACHGTGVAGAPVQGDAAAWAPRIEKGMATLIEHAINGFQAMPPRGACGNCSDEELEAAVQYMVENSQ